MKNVSPSAIGNLMECPKCLWLYFNEGVERPRGIFPSLPSGMDGVFKDYFDGYRKKGELPPEIDGKVDGKLYQDLEKLTKWREIDFGRGGFRAEFPEMDFLLKGAIDELLVNKKGEFVPMDFKTRGYPAKEDTHEHYQHQLDLYALLFEKNGYKPANYGYLIFFHPLKYGKNTCKFHSELKEMKVDKNHGLELLKEAHKIISGPIPSSHEKCEFCLYRDQNLQKQD